MHDGCGIVMILTGGSSLLCLLACAAMMCGVVVAVLLSSIGGGADVCFESAVFHSLHLSLQVSLLDAPCGSWLEPEWVE